MPEARYHAVLYLLLAALVASSGCRIVSPSLVTKTRTDPVYEMRRVEVAGGTDTGEPVYEWRRVQVDVVKRDYKVVKPATGANLAVTFLVFAAVVGLGYGLVYSAQHCKSRECTF